MKSGKKLSYKMKNFISSKPLCLRAEDYLFIKNTPTVLQLMNKNTGELKDIDKPYATIC